ncbi:MAG: hypothetical protein BKP49_05675 [Treponema sp. CETP13]|nr:MAG: hypothetical protein BKP49_05675 [Treponema sp. CETP13]
MKALKKMSAWMYLFISTSLILCLGFVLYIAITFNLLGTVSKEQSKQNLRIFTKTIVNLISQTPNISFSSMNTNSTFEDGDFFIKTVSKNNPDFRITIINKDGTVLADSIGIPLEMENHLTRPEVVAAFSQGEGIDTHISSVFDKELIYYATEFYYNNEKLVIRVSMPTATSVFFTKGTRSNILLVTAIILLVILLRSFFSIKHILQPLDVITEATREYEHGNFSYKPKIESPRELANLSQRMGDMATMIETNIQEIANKSNENEALFNNTAEAIIVFNNNLEIVKYNEKAKDLFFIAESTPQNMPLIQVVRNTEIINFISLQIKSSNSENELETIIPQKNGIPSKHVLVRCSKINRTLQRSQYILSFSDITRLKKLERIRKDFVANVSHELKTPITSIQGFIETLQDGALEDYNAAKHFLEIMDQETKRMNGIISDLLTLSRLEQDQTKLEKAPVNIHELLNSVVLYYKDFAYKKHIKIELKQTEFNKNETKNEKDSALLDTINGNFGLLEQAIGNIVQNAIKYCPEKSTISIETKIEKDTVSITIQDNGSGIPLMAQNRIFERFYRIDKGRSREQGGTGLGLAITKNIILLHGGSVYCKSRLDNTSGSRFVIQLPNFKSN